MNIKEKLKRYIWLCAEREQLEKCIGQLKYKIEKPKIALFVCDRATVNTIARVQDKLVEICGVYTEKLKDICRELDCIVNAIDRLENPLERVVLRERYINNMSWEEISDVIGYEWAQVHRINRNGLRHIEEDLCFACGVK